MKGIGERNNMEEWKEYKLGDVSSVSSSKRIFADEYQSEGIPFYRSKEIIEKQKGISIANELYIKESRYNEIKNKFGVPQKGDILLTSVGTLGIPYLVKDEIFYFKDGNITWFYNFKGINNRYLYYWFLSPIAKHYFDIKAIGSTQKALTIETLKKFDIVLPSKSIQQKVADVLKSFDDKIELNNRINANLEEQAQALFRHWFVDFEFPNEQGLPYKSNGGRFIDSELGKIPEGWKIGCIGDYCKAKSGFAFKSNWWTDKGVKVIKIKNINSDNTLNINDCSYVSEDIALLAKDFYVSDGDLLIAMTGATIGKFAIVVSNEKDLLVNQRVGKFFLGEKPLKKLPFIYNALKQNKISETIINKGQGSAQPNISSNDIESIEIPYSPNILIKKFNETCYPLLYQIIHNQKQNMELTQLRDTLLPRLMNNQIKI